jgi:hypothetical protein
MRAPQALPALQMQTHLTHHLLLLLLHWGQTQDLLQQQLLGRVSNGPPLLQLLQAVQGS